MNTANGPGPYDGQQAITDLLRDVCGLADEAAERITDSAVNARLDSVMKRAGYPPGAEHEVSPAEILAAARREAAEILAAARRGAAEAAAEAACAEVAAAAARHEAEQATAQAEQYQDAALRKAAAIVADARTEAGRIVEEARAEAGRIARDRGRQYVSARSASLAYGNHMRVDSRPLRNIQCLIAQLEDVDKELAHPTRNTSAARPAEAEPADVRACAP